MAKLNLVESLNSKLGRDPILEDIADLFGLAHSPARFDSREEFINHLNEGSMLNIGKLGSDALAVPSGKYVVWTTDAGHTMLVPAEQVRQDVNKSEVFPKLEDFYEVLTPSLTDNWNKLERVLFEEQPPQFGQEQEHDEEGAFKGGIDMSTVDRTPIARAMQERGMTETQLAAECGVDVPAISRILRRPKDTPGDPGGRNPSMQLASKICAALRLDPKAAFPDFFKVDPGQHARRTPGNKGSGMDNAAAGSTKKGAASELWTQGNAGL